ncbi:hypothetical protein FCV25MIE_05089 [Fagus crenata]
MAGKTKDTRLNVPIFPILDSKRNNGDMHDHETAGELVGKKVTHVAGTVSDHLALLVSLKARQGNQRRKKVVRRFEEKWATVPTCEEVIRTAWQQTVTGGSPMFELAQKITRCRHALCDWSRGAFGVHDQQLQHKLETIEALTVDNTMGQHNQQIRAIKDEVNLLLHQDEIYWRQRSREIWLAAGDKNTKFFHQKAKQRRGKNMIKGVLDHNGVWCDEERQIGEVAVKYFDDIFSASPVLEVGSVVQHINRIITDDMNRALLSPFTAVEVREAMFQMHPLKAPGPDGYMLQKINHSHIVLIPKKKDPQAISDYRPISLSNVVYKLISKQIPLTSLNTEDTIRWKAESTGMFTVKSAYQLAVSAASPDKEEGCSNIRANRKTWRVIWKQKLPNKVKIHLWRACLNVLPTRLSLCRRRILQDSACQVCRTAPESPTHALWSCPYAGSVWALIPGKIQKLPPTEVDFFELFQGLTERLTRAEVEIWSVTVWAIWYARNKFLHENVLMCPQTILEMGMRLLNDFQRVTAQQSSSGT